MKRQLPPGSEDDYKSPSVIKKRQKQDNLDKFFHVQKPIKQDPSMQKSNTISSKKSNSNQLSKKFNNQPHHKSLQPQYQRLQTLVPQKIQFRRVPLTKQQKDILSSNYLNPKHTHVCQTCFKDITNYSKIYLSQKIHCISCAAKLITNQYTLIRALHDCSLDEFTQQKRKQDRTLYNWNLKDQLLLIEGMEIYGLDSYEQIKKHMKTHHTVEQIKEHQLHFVDKYVVRQFGGKQLIENCIIRDQDEQKNEIQQKRRRNITNRNRVQRKQKLLRILQYNQKRDEFGHQIPGLYSLLLSQVDISQQSRCVKQQQLLLNEQQQVENNNNKQQQVINNNNTQQVVNNNSNNFDRIQFLLKGYKNEQQIRYYQQKIIKQMKFDVPTYQNLQMGRIKQQIKQNNIYQKQQRQIQRQQQRWKLIQCEIKQKYNLYDKQSQQKQIAKKLTRRMRLLDRLILIQAQASQQLKILYSNFCANNKLNQSDITQQEFQSQLPQTIAQNIYKMDQVLNIQSQLQQINIQ